MSQIDQTKYLHSIVCGHHYPNNITYDLEYMVEKQESIIRCKACHNLGIVWYLSITDSLLNTSFMNIGGGGPGPGHIREILVQHALKHNDLVKKITEKMLLLKNNVENAGNVMTIYEGYDVPTVDNFFKDFIDKLSLKLKEMEKPEKPEEKHNDFRSIELSEEK